MLYQGWHLSVTIRVSHKRLSWANQRIFALVIRIQSFKIRISSMVMRIILFELLQDASPIL